MPGNDRAPRGVSVRGPRPSTAPPSPPALTHPALAPADRPSAVYQRIPPTAGILVTVTGLSGVGKTTWLRQFTTAARRHRVVMVTADAFERDFPYGLADKIAHAIGIRAGVLGETPNAPDPLAVVRVLLTTIAEGTTRGRRLVLVIDDAHCIDDASVKVLRFVLSRLAHDGLCVVLGGLEPRVDEIATLLAEGDPAAWAEQRAVRLEPLDAPQTRTYLSAVHGQEVSLRLAERIVALSGGLPVLIDSLAAGMRCPAGSPHPYSDATMPLPELHDSRFDDVDRGQPDAVVTAVQICAVLTDAVGDDEVAAIAAALGEPADVDAALSAGLLARSAEGVRPFHGLYGKDVLDHLDDSRRTAVLEAAGSLLHNPHRAFLCRLAATPALDEALLRDLFDMVDAAAAVGHHDRALRYLRLALEATSDPRQHDDLVVATGIRAGTAMFNPTALELLPELERLPSDPARDLALLQARALRGDAAWALEKAAALLDERPGHPDADLVMANVAMTEVLVRFATGRHDDLLDSLDRARGIADAAIAAPRPVTDQRLQASTDPHQIRVRCIALTVVAAAIQHRLDRLPQALRDLDDAIADAADSPALFDALACRANVRLGAGAVPAAMADLERALALAARGLTGLTPGHVRVSLAQCHWLLGHRSEAMSLLESATMAVFDSVDLAARRLLFLLKAVLAAVAGDERGYRLNMATADDVVVTASDTAGIELELLAEVEHARAQNRPDLVLQALAPQRLAGHWLPTASILTYQVDALATLGMADEAQQALERLAALNGVGWAPVYGSLDWLQGRVAEARGHVEAAIRSYRVAVLATQLPLPRAQACLDAGRLLVASGRVKAGQRLLRQAAEGFRRVGATPALRRALALQQSDAPEPAAVSGLESLTAREREVATLAEGGMTNAEIAHTLYLSPPTVSFHMRNVLAKLGLSSRRELRGVMRTGGVQASR